MLAYVLWHRGGGDVERHTYESRIARFHSALAGVAPEGFSASYVFVVGSLPWIQGEPVYEEWYLLDDYGALGELERAVQGEELADAHARVAANSVSVTASLFGLRSGSGDPRPAAQATWLRKPADMSYADFDAAMVLALDEEGAGLWQRRLVLGSSSEFCLLADEQPFASSEIVVATARRDCLWAAG